MVDLFLGGPDDLGPSEYELLVDDVKPLLQGLSLGELTEDDNHADISFLAGETGRDPTLLAFLILADRLAPRTRLPGEVFYGLFRGNLPTSLPALLAQDREVNRAALESSLDANLIPVALRPRVEEFLAPTRAAQCRRSRQGPSGSDGSELRRDSRNRPWQIRRCGRPFIAKYASHAGTITEFWAAVRQDPKLAPHTDSLQLTLQFAALAGNHLPLVQHLQGLRQTGASSSLRDLVRFDPNGWRAVVEGPTRRRRPARRAGSG